MNALHRVTIPADWRWQPINSLASVSVSTVDKKSYSDERPVLLCNYTDVYYNSTITSPAGFMESTASPAQIRQFQVRKGDVAITKDSETSEDVGRPAYIARDLDNTVYGYHLAIYRPYDPRYGRFIRYLFDDASIRADLRDRTPGVTRVGLSQDTLRHLKVPVPSPSVAGAVADYLDRETAEIDAFIAELGTLANLEDEKVQSISHSLLAAYEQNDWTPAHLGPLVVIPRGQVDPRVTPYNEMYLVAPNHIESRTGRILDLQTAADQGADSGKYLAEKGQVVFSKIRPTLMKAAIAPLDCLTSADMYPMEPNRKFISARFLLEFLLGPQFEAFAATESARVAMPKLNRETLAMAPLLLPPLGVQDNIVESLGAARAAAEYVKELVFSATELAKERRAALISAAVTGQIDVTARNKPAVEQLQDELEGK